MMLGENIGAGFEDVPSIMSSFFGFFTTSYYKTGSNNRIGSVSDDSYKIYGLSMYKQIIKSSTFFLISIVFSLLNELLKDIKYRL